MDWAGKKVMVTGAGGFIGSHLTERLLQEGAQVKALVRYSSTSSTGWLAELPRELVANVDVAYGDVRDAEHTAQVMDGCEVVFHLAALISVAYSFEAPSAFVDANVQGTVNVLHAARRCGVSRLVHTSTSEVYGTPSEVPIKETHPLQAQSPYAASKMAADKMAESFYHTYELPVVILRPFNTYGPRQSARAVLIAILTQLIAGRSEIRLGALWPRRDLTYVTDTVDGFVKAAEAENAIGATVQLGTGRDISIGDLAELAKRVLGVKAEIVCEAERMRPSGSEVERLLSDPSKAATLIGWKPAVDLEQGIEATAAWLRAKGDTAMAGKYLV